MILDVFQCSQLFYDVFSWVGTFMDNHPMCAQNAPQNVRTGGGYALHRERFYKSYNPAENIEKQLRTLANI